MTVENRIEQLEKIVAKLQRQNMTLYHRAYNVVARRRDRYKRIMDRIYERMKRWERIKPKELQRLAMVLRGNHQNGMRRSVVFLTCGEHQKLMRLIAADGRRGAAR